jgi:membrane protein insertase Oxa1/YidC/SpoIIIJ
VKLASCGLSPAFETAEKSLTDFNMPFTGHISYHCLFLVNKMHFLIGISNVFSIILLAIALDLMFVNFHPELDRSYFCVY